MTSLTCVSVSTPSARPSYIAGEAEDEFVVINIGSPFRYIIPRFDVLSVELCQMRIAGNAHGTGPVYDIFVRNDDGSLSQSYPVNMRVKDFLRVEVRK